MVPDGRPLSSAVLMAHHDRRLEPHASRPHIPEYGIPDDEAGLLPWHWAQERLDRALLYWVATTRPDRRPHSMPTWGAWVDDAFWFEGGLATRRARNLAANPSAVLSVAEGAEDVVILEGTTERIEDPDRRLADRIVSGFAKYRATKGYEVDPANWRTGGLWVLRPVVGFGWSRYPDDATRWTFER